MISFSVIKTKIFCYAILLFLFITIDPIYSNDNILQNHENYPLINNLNIFMERDFKSQIEESAETDEFRIIVKINSDEHLKLLFSDGIKVVSFASYSGFALTLSKNKIMSYVSKGIFNQIWNNSLIYASSMMSINQFESSRVQCNFTEQTNVQYLWQQGFFGNFTKVAILDTGISLTHPALMKNMVGENRIIASKNFLDDVSTVQDDNGHGTEVAGIIGANGQSGYMRGLAPNCNFLVGKILDYDSIGTVEMLLEGIDWALENEADVINLSLGRVVPMQNTPESEAVNYAVSQGVIVCCAAGNARGLPELGYSDKNTILSPGIATQAITVGAVDNNNILFEESSAGPVTSNYNSTSGEFIFDSVKIIDSWIKPDILAPGVLLNTTSPLNPFSKIVSGTSYSTAVVSGICLLLKQQNPEYYPSQFKAAILKGADQSFIEYDTPLGNPIYHTIAQEFQGAGVVNLSETSEILLALPQILIWPFEFPTVNQNFFTNEERCFKIHLFINNAVSNFSISMSRAIQDNVIITNIPENPSIGQYDLNIFFTTKDAFVGYHYGIITIETSDFIYNVTVQFQVVRAKGRILFYCGERGQNQFYSMYGSSNSLIYEAKELGLESFIYPKDNPLQGFSSYNLNDFEIIALLNYNNSLIKSVSIQEEISLIDYIMKEGTYSGGSIIVLPSPSTDLLQLNNLLQSHEINYSPLFDDNLTVDLSGEEHLLANNLFSIYSIFIPSPFNVSNIDDTQNTMLNLFAISDQRDNNGSLVIACNNLEMFSFTPYLYLPSESRYEPSLLNLGYVDNDLLLDNILSASIVSQINFDYSLNEEELSMRDILSFTIDVHNQYKPMTNLHFSLSLEDSSSNSFLEYRETIDLGNGTYIIKLRPSDFSIQPGTYTLVIRSFYEKYTCDIHLIATVSWGPIIVSFSIIVCVVYLLTIRKKQNHDDST